MARIAHILGNWAPNIGNAFFQLGGLHVLRKVLPTAEVMLIGEQPGYPSYWNRRGGNPRNAFDVPGHLEVDYLVLMGPVLRPEFGRIWGPSLERLAAQGTRLIILGLGSMRYEQEEMAQYRLMLRRAKPFIVTTRDSETFQLIGDLATHSYDGIDLAFFMPEVYAPVGFRGERRGTVVLNFDKIPEPTIELTSGEIRDVLGTVLDASFEHDGMWWRVRFPRFRTWFAARSRYAMAIEKLCFPGNQVARIGTYEIIRPDHRAHLMIGRRAFRYPNVVVSDTPYVYAEVYSHAALTLSSRVHACVLALAYGNRAMLFSKTGRAKLLTRLGLEEIGRRPVTLAAERLRCEKEALVEFLGLCLR